MRVISDEPKVQVEYEESYALVIGFPTDVTDFKKGQSCALKTDGSVERITDGTKRPLGVIVSAFQGTDKGNVRVLTQFGAILSNAIASGTVDEGDLVAYAGEDSAGLPKYKKAVAGDYVSGQALRGGATTTSIQVGILRTGAVKVV